MLIQIDKLQTIISLGIVNEVLVSESEGGFFISATSKEATYFLADTKGNDKKFTSAEHAIKLLKKHNIDSYRCTFMNIKVFPYQMADFIKDFDMEIEMVISNNLVYFQAKSLDKNILFVTSRGETKTFKSISACRDFITTFLNERDIAVKIINH